MYCLNSTDVVTVYVKLVVAFELSMSGNYRVCLPWLSSWVIFFRLGGLQLCRLTLAPTVWCLLHVLLSMLACLTLLCDAYCLTLALVPVHLPPTLPLHSSPVLLLPCRCLLPPTGPLSILWYTAGPLMVSFPTQGLWGISTLRWATFMFWFVHGFCLKSGLPCSTWILRLHRVL